MSVQELAHKPLARNQQMHHRTASLIITLSYGGGGPYWLAVPIASNSNQCPLLLSFHLVLTRGTSHRQRSWLARHKIHKQAKSCAFAERCINSLYMRNLSIKLLRTQAVTCREYILPGLNCSGKMDLITCESSMYKSDLNLNLKRCKRQSSEAKVRREIATARVPSALSHPTLKGVEMSTITNERGWRAVTNQCSFAEAVLVI